MTMFHKMHSVPLTEINFPLKFSSPVIMLSTIVVQNVVLTVQYAVMV